MTQSLLRAVVAASALSLAHGAIVGYNIYSTFDCTGTVTYTSPPVAAPLCTKLGQIASLKLEVTPAAIVHIIGFGGTECSYGAGTFYDLGSLPGNMCLPLPTLFATLTGAKAIKLTVLTDGDLVGIAIAVLIVIFIGTVFYWHKYSRGPYAPGSSWPIFIDGRIAAVKAALQRKAPATTTPPASATKVVVVEAAAAVKADVIETGAPAADTNAATTAAEGGVFASENPMHIQKKEEGEAAAAAV